MRHADTGRLLVDRATRALAHSATTITVEKPGATRPEAAPAWAAAFMAAEAEHRTAAVAVRTTNRNSEAFPLNQTMREKKQEEAVCGERRESSVDTNGMCL